MDIVGERLFSNDFHDDDRPMGNVRSTTRTGFFQRSVQVYRPPVCAFISHVRCTIGKRPSSFAQHQSLYKCGRGREDDGTPIDTNNNQCVANVLAHFVGVLGCPENDTTEVLPGLPFRHLDICRRKNKGKRFSYYPTPTR